MPDLSTTYLGMKLKSPLVASSGPLCRDVDQLRQIEGAGAGAIVLHSLFEEQINLESYELDRWLSPNEGFAEAQTYLPDLTAYNIGPEGYVEHLEKAKKAVGIPVIGSLNGVSSGGWIRYAKLIEEAGADALELNIYYLPTNPAMDSAQVEMMHTELVSEVKESIRIPVAVKLGAYFSSIPNMMAKLDRAGANGLVLFNRFYQPDFDLESLEVVPNLALSDSHELLMRLH
jgi:dihydroorotate dehydrogenase (fumarate)